MAPLVQVGRNGGPNKCFTQFQKSLECMTNINTKSNDECAMLRNDYIECRRHRLETYKMFVVSKHLEEERDDLNKDDIGAPFVKVRDYLTPKTLGLVNGDDRAIAVNKY
ncbi:hypothetical protein CANARDRAFT_28731 [[Candida] arabinofermentans NRRL YB-2248]|uniref:CHCH domain-containing protein n=1 Tax=[Candida] arabinofermentans NRRL YB-2248 TaxID=983967 RepID=A0A1E4SZR7_9ASCO|nr:hypothetical protein CANARDRAFT_28731 [[Candida] arabinofermentans NRRL YB-2248]